MGIVDKAENAAEELAGKAKEAVGEKTDNADLKAEGQADQAGARTKKTGENINDAFKG